MIETMLHVFLWGSLLCYVVSFIPQLMTNYRRKSTVGLSAMMIFANFSSYLSASIYAVLLDLPLSIQVLLPLGACLSACVVTQSIWYEKNTLQRRRLLLVYAGVLIAGALTMWEGSQQPELYGNIAGWIGSALWLSYNIPQILHFHAQKSVRGFNFLVAVMGILGSLAECIAAIGLGLPAQTLMNASSSLFFGLLYVYKFALYSKESWQQWLGFA